MGEVVAKKSGIRERGADLATDVAAAATITAAEVRATRTDDRTDAAVTDDTARVMTAMSGVETAATESGHETGPNDRATNGDNGHHP